jgi:hypothetical protein
VTIYCEISSCELSKLHLMAGSPEQVVFAVIGLNIIPQVLANNTQ